MTKTLNKTLVQRVTALEKENAKLREDVNFQLCDFSKTQGVVSVHSIWLDELREKVAALEEKNVELEKKLAKKKNKKKKKKPEGWAVDMTPEQMKEYEMWHRGYGEW